MENFYSILEIAQTASESEIKKAYYKLALRWHPDKNNSHEAEDKFKQVAMAYDVLGTPEKRLEYDRQLRPQTRSSNNFFHSDDIDPSALFRSFFASNSSLFNSDPFNDPFFTQSSLLNDPFFSNSINHNFSNDPFFSSMNQRPLTNQKPQFSQDTFFSSMNQRQNLPFSNHHRSMQSSSSTPFSLNSGSSRSKSTRIVNGRVEITTKIVDEHGNETVEIERGIQGQPLEKQIFVNGIENGTKKISF